MLSKNQVREIRALHLKKYRASRKQFIAEGAKTVGEILEQRPAIVQAVYAQAGFLEKYGAVISRYAIAAVAVDEDELRSISLQTTPNLVLAVCRQPDEEPRTSSAQPFSFYLDEIRDPGNFGTIVRLCDWFGATQLYCSPGSCELYNPKVIQASMGAFLRVAVHYETLEQVIARGFTHVYGAVLDGKNIYRETLSPGLIVIGNEANGISAAHLPLITHPLTIPAHAGNGSESLNAAMAAAIVASEFFRQTV